MPKSTRLWLATWLVMVCCGSTRAQIELVSQLEPSGSTTYFESQDLNFEMRWWMQEEAGTRNARLDCGIVSYRKPFGKSTLSRIVEAG